MNPGPLALLAYLMGFVAFGIAAGYDGESRTPTRIAYALAALALIHALAAAWIAALTN